ncbi:MAG: AmmeMemoRadiSam system protein B [Spirochaetaceae bacterium]|jgi:AmmeMemoRadiSam system protein B|nr:AmmeMemoRadiSam system protein B [Spirochaetaceae bacterium]
MGEMKEKAIRRMRLPPGWYPRNAAEIDGYLCDCLDKREGGANAVIAPHAGWFFSGKLAALALSRLRKDADTVIVSGGHLGAEAPVMFAEEDAICTPLGEMPVDGELRSVVKRNLLQAGLCCAPDNYTDNTVEVLLPAVHRLFPKASILWLRLGSGMRAAEAGRLIARAAASLGRNVVMAGSTDLTHYGPSYNFCPKGRGNAALEWVKTVNDRRFIEALTSGATEDIILERAVTERSACSAGAVLCALGFASETRGAATSARLLAYSTSADVTGMPSASDSFVGYAAVEVC